MPIAGALWANSGLMHCNKKERPLCGNDEASQNLVSQPSDAIIDILIMGCRTLTPEELVYCSGRMAKRKGLHGNAKVSASGERDCLKVLSALVAAVRHPAAEVAL
jgi:hypothetical protein